MSRPASTWGRAALAALLFVGFYALAIALAATLAALPLLELAAIHRLTIQLALVGWGGAAIIAWSILPRPDRFEPPGPPLTRGENPALFALIDAVAAAAEQAPPTDVYLVGNVNAFVAERGGWFGFGRRRVMGLGLPLLQALTLPELRAVLAHEFGHYHAGDTALGPWIYRTRAAMERTVGNLHGSRHWGLQLVAIPFVAYGKMFLRVTLAVSRAQERAADALAARLEGTAATRSALQRVAQAGALFGSYIEGELDPVLSAGFHPPVAAGFAAYLAAPDVQGLMAGALDAALANEVGDPFDTHPTLAERLAALAALPPGPPTTEGPPAISLLADVPGAERALLRSLAIGDGEPIAWRDVGTRVALPLLRKHAALAQLSGSIAEVPTAAEALAALGRAAAATAPADRHVQLGAQLVTAAVLVRLVEAGFSLDSLPGEAYVARKGEVRFTPAPLLAAIARGEAQPAAWRDAAATAGIDALTL